VGSYGTEIWNGTSWHFVPMATPTGGQVISLNGVSCTSASACTAVGSYFTRNAGPLNLAETWNGTAWRVPATPSPNAQGRNQLNSVSCTSPRACTAVGVDAASDFSPPGRVRGGVGRHPLAAAGHPLPTGHRPGRAVHRFLRGPGRLHRGRHRRRA